MKISPFDSIRGWLAGWLAEKCGSIRVGRQFDCFARRRASRALLWAGYCFARARSAASRRGSAERELRDSSGLRARKERASRAWPAGRPRADCARQISARKVDPRKEARAQVASISAHRAGQLFN